MLDWFSAAKPLDEPSPRAANSPGDLLWVKALRHPKNKLEFELRMAGDLCKAERRALAYALRDLADQIERRRRPWRFR